MRANLHKALTATAVALCLGCISHDAGQTAGPLPRIFADGVQMEHLQARLAELDSQAKNIIAFAESEKRSLNGDEVKELDKIYAAFEEVDAEIKVRERAANMSARAAGGGGRQTNPDLTPNQVAAAAAAAASGDDSAATQHSPALARRVAASARATDTGKWGFRSSGEFIVAVFRASARGATPDPRLIANAPTTFGQEGVGADGGFAVPPDFRATIIKKVAGEESLLSMTDQQTTSSNNITFPVDETEPWGTSGVRVYWESEGGQKTQSKPRLAESTVKANKLIALVPMTDELLDDAPAMTSWLNTKVPEHIDYAVNAAIIRGSGVGQPLGILNSAGLLTVAAESGQAADTLRFENIVNLYTRMPAASKRRAVWLMNDDNEGQLMKMQFPGTGTAVPVYLPPGGLSAAPYGTLMGRPVIPTEAASALGDPGDIIFADMSKYMTLVKGGLKQDISIHLWFDYDITAFRFVLRIGGKPWFNSVIERANGLSRSFFVTLGAR